MIPALTTSFKVCMITLKTVKTKNKNKKGNDTFTAYISRLNKLQTCLMWVSVTTSVLSFCLFSDDPGTVLSQEQCPELRETTSVQSGNIRLEETLPLLLRPAAHDPDPDQPGTNYLDS